MLGFALLVGVVAGVDAVLADVDCPEVPVVGVDPEPVDPGWEEVSVSDEEPLPVVGVEAEELTPELDPELVPVAVPLALCANAGSKGITIASVKITKKTAQPVVARRKKS